MMPNKPELEENQSPFPEGQEGQDSYILPGGWGKHLYTTKEKEELQSI